MDPTPYDLFPYLEGPCPPAHPDRLAVIGALLGLRPAAVERCRVLELGCGRGGNLLPMAAALPESEFLGVDLSGRQIDEASEAARALGLDNLRFERCDLGELPGKLGEVDYILCHGVYSWVPAATREAIWQICERHLSPGGIAYISYNTLPGWCELLPVRDLMLYHTAGIADPDERLRQARAAVKFMAEATPPSQERYKALLAEEAEQLATSADAYVLHEYLEPDNTPFYFRQVEADARRHGMQFLAEAEFHQTTTAKLAPEVARQIELTDFLTAQQYLDFARNTRFRRSLFCRSQAPVNRQVDAGRLAGLLVTTPLRPENASLDLSSRSMETFACPQGRISADTPLLKAAMVALASEAPRAIPFPQLVDRACMLAGLTSSPDHQENLANEILAVYAASSLLVLHAHQARLAHELTARPVACPVARLKAGRGGTITTRWHRPVERISAAMIALLQALDGTRDRAALLAILEGEVLSERLSLTEDERPVTDPARRRHLLAEGIDRSLRELLTAGVLVG